MRYRMLLSACALVAGGCGGASRPDYAFPEDVPDADAYGEDAGGDAPAPEPPTVTFTAPAANAAAGEAGGGLAFTIILAPPAGGSLDKAVLQATVAGKTVVLAEADAAALASGTWTGTSSTAGLPDGDLALTCRVTTKDGRTGSTKLTVRIDNTPPVIEEIVALPADASLDDPLVLGYRLKDDGGVAGGEILVDGIRAWQHAPATGPWPVEVTTAGPEGDLEVPTETWARHAVKVAVSARDRVGNTARLDGGFEFVPRPAFSGNRLYPVPGDFQASLVEGMKLGDAPALLLGTGREVRAYRLQRRALKEVGRFEPSQGQGLVDFEVRDMNLDGREDLVVLSSNRVSIFLQDAAGGLAESWASGIEAEKPRRFTALAVGPLNPDSWPDVAVAVDTEGPSLAFCLSEEKPGGVTWALREIYGGVPNPNLLSAGRLTRGDAPQMDVLLGRGGSQTLTVFEVDEASGIPFGGLNQIPTVDGKPVGDLLAVGVVQGAPDRAGVAVWTDARSSTISYSRITSQGLSMPVRIETGLHPYRMDWGDLLGQGFEHLFVACRDSNMLMHLLPRNGGGLVANRRNVPLPGSPLDLAVTDLLGDDTREVAVLVDSRGAREWARAVVVLGFAPATATDPEVAEGGQCTGGGSGTGGMISMSAYEPSAMVAGEFIGAKRDRIKDLALLAKERSTGRTVVVLLAADELGEPTVLLPSVIPVDLPGAESLLAANLDGQGLDDLVIVSSGSGVNGAALLFQPGENPDAPAYLVASGEIRLGAPPHFVTLADLDGPGPGQGVGTPDLASAAMFPCNGGTATTCPAVQVLTGVGDGSFALGPSLAWLTPERRPSGITAGPFSGRLPRNDLAVVFGDTNDFTVLFQDAGGSFPDPIDYVAAGLQPRGVAWGGMEGPDDLMPDVVTLLQRDVVVSYASQSGGNIRYGTSHFLAHPGRTPAAVAVADVNLDGWPDLLVANAADADVQIHLNVRRKSFLLDPEPLVTGPEPTALVVTDITGDGMPDVATMDKASRSVTFYRNVFARPAP